MGQEAVSTTRTGGQLWHRPSPHPADGPVTEPLISPRARAIDALTVQILEGYAAQPAAEPSRFGHDVGPIVLASLALSAGAASHELAERVLSRWLRELPEQIGSVGAFGGLGGFIAGVRAGAAIRPELSSLADALIDETRRWLRETRWLSAKVAWLDYDLFRGPAGLVLAGAARGRSTAPFVPAAHHLAQLCAEPNLEPLRAGTEIDPRSAFNVGRINTGMGHGVAGVASALRHAVEIFETGDEYRAPLEHACAWLAQQAYLAKGNFITWPPVGRDGGNPSPEADHRQAWCYGTPGVAWSLWDAGHVLGDSSLQDLGAEAMQSFLLNFDEEKHLDRHDIGEALSICHGAAGTLAVAETFLRHGDLREARTLRDYLEAYLLARSADIVSLSRINMSILTGAGGIMSVLLTVNGGKREWLAQLALR